MTPQRVSQHHVEREWRKYTTVADATCHPYALDGHLCVGVRFPTAGKAWVYDCTASEWHERESHAASVWDISSIVEHRGQMFVQRATPMETACRSTSCTWE